MALSASSLAGKIKTQIESQFGAADDATKLQKFCLAVATAVVQEITANAQVSTTGTVTTGSGAGGTVTTTGTVS